MAKEEEKSSEEEVEGDGGEGQKVWKAKVAGPGQTLEERYRGGRVNPRPAAVEAARGAVRSRTNGNAKKSLWRQVAEVLKKEGVPEWEAVRDPAKRMRWVRDSLERGLENGLKSFFTGKALAGM